MSTLKPGDFTTVLDDNFAKDTSVNQSIWTDSWGYANQFSFANGALTLTGYEQPYWQGVAIMQRATGPSAGEGYGLFQFSGYANAGQGLGINFILWRADNQWVDAAAPNMITEIDVLESWDGTRTGESTVHYYNTAWPSNDGYTSHQFSVDLTKPNTYAVLWAPGSLTYYVNNQEIYQVTGSSVPRDYADGGCNYVMGAQVVGENNSEPTSTVQLHITDMRYSTPGASAPAPVPPNAVTLGGGSQSYAAAAGMTVQAGSGSDTITASQGAVLVNGSSGQLQFIGGSGASTVFGGTGSATIEGGTGGGAFSGGAAGGNLLIAQGASGSNTTLTGGGAGDRLFGSAGGHDVLVAGPGHDSLVGGGGATAITGGSSAASVIFTGAGATSVTGGAAGGDSIIGGSGALTVAANRGDAVFGGNGNLAVSGSTSGADSIIGGAGALDVAERGGNMLVVAGSGQSTIATGNGASLIFGGSGGSSVTGGAGSMQVLLGSGTLTATEGSGVALYDVVKGDAGGTAVLEGFRAATDRIQLFGYTQSELGETVGGGSTLIGLSDGTKIQLVGVTDPGHAIIL